MVIHKNRAAVSAEERRIVDRQPSLRAARDNNDAVDDHAMLHVAGIVG